ncbi:MAG: cyclic peptide export ABC transporter [Deltaproteobacteria bacterium]|nr:cyclic peptide export ABC transporter [Deltaproteobacteria bacterium]
MNLFRLLQTLGKNPRRRLLRCAVISALSTTAVVAVVTYVAQKINETGKEFVDLPMAALFVAGVLLYMVYESRMIAQLAADIEEAIDRLRMQLIGRLRQADLWRLEHFGQSRLFGNITQSCKVISSNSQYLAQAVRSIVLIATILLYIATVSLIAFGLLTALLAVAAAAYYWLNRSLDEHQEELADQEGKLFECVSDLFDGFKEQRLCSARSRALGEAFGRLSNDTVTARSEVHRQTWQLFAFGKTTFNLMMGLVIFVVPIYSSSVSAELVKICAAVLFMTTPLFGLMQSLTVLRAAEAAAGRMITLEGELMALAEQGSGEPSESVPADFTEIRMEGLAFAFPAPTEEPPFTLGPLDVSIRRGEVIFVTGGNGSGKSTFIKLLTGLYHPERGRLTVDGVEISPARLADYRALVAPVFSDFHLFTRLYGLDKIDRIAAEDLLRWMEMERAAGFAQDRFTRIDLSTGQRKRLALIAALLETKPILILDEWAADQDSHFRKKFYREVLPELRRRGLTIIAVTHDDRYFDAADRRLHFEEGRLSERPAGVEAAG